MKIKALEFANHPILGKLNLDLRDENGNAADTIILAGDNGCGKTVILDFLYGLLRNFPTKVHSKNEFWISFQLTKEEVLRLQTDPQTKGPFALGIKDNELVLKSDSQQDVNQAHFHLIDNNGTPHKFKATILNQSTLKDIIRPVFTPAEITFASGTVNSVTTTKLDNDFGDGLKTDGSFAQQLAQLFVDISAADNADIKRWFDKNVNKMIEEAMDGDEVKRIQSGERFNRFKIAFEKMFENKELKEVSDDHQIMFEEFGKSSTLDQLSSGEKQIVFRGGFLIKNKKSMNGSVVLIDEPEISLHPCWQQKVLDFYRDLFLNEEGEQTSQFFVATHSPYVLQSANNALIKILRREKGQTFVVPTKHTYGWTPDQLTIEAFGLEDIRPKGIREDLKKYKQYLSDIREGKRAKDDSKFMEVSASLHKNLLIGDHEFIAEDLFDLLQKMKNDNLK